MIETIDVVDTDGMAAAWAIRMEVFVDEQKVPAEEEVDALDTAPTTFHVLALVDSVPAGTGRLLFDSSGHVHIGRMAVRSQFRKSGVGAHIMSHLEGIALAEHGVEVDGALEVTVVLSAQERAMGFYQKLGYEAVTGERYLDAGIWHQDMSRVVSDRELRI